MGIRQRAERGINPAREIKGPTNPAREIKGATNPAREINRSTHPARGNNNQSGVANPDNPNQNGMGNSGSQNNTTKALREAESRLGNATRPNAVQLRQMLQNALRGLEEPIFDNVSDRIDP